MQQTSAPAGFAPIAVGLALTLIPLISIPVTNTLVNPARSTGVAPFVGDWAVGQLWLFCWRLLLGPSLERVRIGLLVAKSRARRDELRLIFIHF